MTMARAPPSVMRARCRPPPQRWSTAPRSTARISTTHSKAARSMPARSSCRRCWRLASGTSLDGRAALLGIAVGVETMCRLSTVAPTLTHKAGFHPTAVFGAMGAAAGVGAALKLTPRQLVDALGTAASMASGIIEYLAEGAWTKRLHAGWAAQSGIRAALLGRAGFLGPAHGVRRRARLLSRFCPHHQGRLRRADRRLRHALGDARRWRSSLIRAGP